MHAFHFTLSASHKDGGAFNPTARLWHSDAHILQSRPDRSITAASGRPVRCECPNVRGTRHGREVVQARGVSLDDGGATTTPWTDVATIAANGTWSGVLTAPRSASWFQPEARLKSTPAVVSQGANRFGVGHALAIWGQSEPDRIISLFYDDTPDLRLPTRRQSRYLSVPHRLARYFVTAAQPYTALLLPRWPPALRSPWRKVCGHLSNRCWEWTPLALWSMTPIVRGTG